MASKIYQISESSIIWTDSPAPTTFSLSGLGSDEGRYGDYYDLSENARSPMYAWRAWIKFDVQPVVGEVVAIALITSDGLRPDIAEGTEDGPLSSAEKMINLRRLQPIRVDEAEADILMVSSGLAFLPHRYVAPAFWNHTQTDFSAIGDACGFSLTPVPLILQ